MQHQNFFRLYNHFEVIPSFNLYVGLKDQRSYLSVRCGAAVWGQSTTFSCKNKSCRYYLIFTLLFISFFFNRNSFIAFYHSLLSSEIYATPLDIAKRQLKILIIRHEIGYVEHNSFLKYRELFEIPGNHLIMPQLRDQFNISYVYTVQTDHWRIYAVCCDVRGRALASHTDVYGFEPQSGGWWSSLTCWQL